MKRPQQQAGSLKGSGNRKLDHKQHLRQKQGTSTMREKGSRELPEKQHQNHHGNRIVNYIDHLYGLDNDGATSESQSDTASVYETSGISNSSGNSLTSQESDSHQPWYTQTLGRWMEQCRHRLVLWLRNRGLISQATGREARRSHRGGRLRRKTRHPFYLYLPILIFMPLVLAWISGVDVKNPMSLCQRQSVSLQDEQLNALREQTLQLIQKHNTQTDRQTLTREHTEALVDKILTSKLAQLKEQLVATSSSTDTWIKWRDEQDSTMRELTRRYDALWAQVQSVQRSVSSFQLEMNTEKQAAKSETHTQTAQLEERLAALHIQLHELQTQHRSVLEQANSSCSNKAEVEDTVTDILTQALLGNGSTGDTETDSFREWFGSQYISREDLDRSLQDTATTLTGKLTELVDSQLRLSMSAGTQSADTDGQGTGPISQMISEALLKFDADKLGLADFALEFSGGSIVKSRCTSTYHRKTSVIKLFGLPFWYFSNTPRTAIQPQVHAGECWAFEGSTGYLVIRTGYTIVPSGFTLEHLPRTVSPTGDIASAPKNFMVIGLSDEQDYMGHWLGNFTYLDNNTPVQHFPCQMRCAGKAFDLFELRILNNQGNPEYTCVYRFRIHGKIYTPNM